MSDIIGGTPKAGAASPEQRPRVLSRRAALLAPLALAGCDTITGWFDTKKDPLPGTREAVGAPHRGFAPDQTVSSVALPPQVLDTSWPQAAGDPTHLMG